MQKALQKELRDSQTLCRETHDAQIKKYHVKYSEWQERAKETRMITNSVCQFPLNITETINSIPQYHDHMEKARREHLYRQEMLRKEIEATSAAKMDLEKEKLTLQSKAKFDSTRQQNKSEEEQWMVCFDAPHHMYSRSSLDH